MGDLWYRQLQYLGQGIRIQATLLLNEFTDAKPTFRE
jgi:hypothetical protein